MSIKRMICTVLPVFMVIASLTFTPVYAENKGISVLVDGKTIAFDQPPVLDKTSGKVLVPMRGIFEAIGYTVAWDETQKTANAIKETPTSKVLASVKLPISIIYVEYQDYQTPQDKENSKKGKTTPYNYFCFERGLGADSPIKIIDGKIFLPTRAIAEVLGCNVSWNNATKTVSIDTANARIVPPDGWEVAIQAHYKKYAPEYYRADLAFKGSWDSTFISNGVQGKAPLSAVVPTTTASPTNATRPPTLPTNPTGKRTTVTIDSKEYPVIYRKDSDGVEYATIVMKNANDTIYRRIKFLDNLNGQKPYYIYDDYRGYYYEYVYKAPQVPQLPPQEGSVPAKILRDENKSHELFIPMGDGSVEHNAMEAYDTDNFGSCNWYAGGRFWEIYGIPFPHFDKFATEEVKNDNNWLATATKYQEFIALSDRNDIRPYSVAVYGKGKDGVGHYAFVEYVEKDSNGTPQFVYVTEANLDSSNSYAKYRYGVDGVIQKMSIQTFLNRSGKSVIGYIVPNPQFYN